MKEAILKRDQSGTLARLVRVWQHVDGPDKSAKILQYGIRLMVAQQLPGHAHVEPAVKALSKCRRGMRLGRWTYDLPNLIKLIEKDQWTFWDLIDISNGIAAVFNDFFDDCSFLGSLKLPFIPPSLFRVAERWADKCWLITCVFDIVLVLRNLTELNDKIRSLKKGDEQLRGLQAKRFMMIIGLMKLGGDFGIAWPSAFQLSSTKTKVAVFGLVSGVCSLYKLWDKAKR